jgi:hypothetical protein
MKATITRSYYDWNGRKYFEVKNEEGTSLRIKIPFRYGRVMCRTEGLKTIQEFQKGEQIEIEIERKVWDGEVHWVLVSISPVASL